MGDCWRKIPAQAKRCGVSGRTFRSYLKLGLPYAKLPTGTILVKDKDADAWLEGFYQSNNHSADIDAIVDDVMAGMNGWKK